VRLTSVGENAAFCLQLRDPYYQPRFRLRNSKLADPDLVFGPGGQVSILETSPVAASPFVPLPSQTLQQSPSVPISALPSTDQIAVPAGWQSDKIPISPQHQETFQGSTISRLEDTASTLASPPTGSIPNEISPASLSGAPVTSQPYMTPSGSAFALTSTTSPSSSLLSPSFSMSTLVSPTTVSVSESRHGVFFYAIIAFAVLLVISIAIAVVAWRIRLRRYAQRRLDDASLQIPWANYSSFDKLEEACSPVSFAGSIGANTLQCNELIGMGHWALADDKDLAQSDPIQRTILLSAGKTDHARQSFHSNAGDGSIFRFCQHPFREGIHPSTTRTASASDSVYQKNSNLGHLQVANLMPGDVATSYDGSQPGTERIGYSGERMSPEFGTPREAVDGPQLKLEGQALALPRAPLRPRRSNQWKDVAANWDHLPPLPFPGETQQSESWAESIKANLIHAFNAVAENLTRTAPILEGDNLTTIPSRSSRHSRSDLDSDSHKPIEDVKVEASSKGWHAIEKQESAGTGCILNYSPWRSYDKNKLPFPPHEQELAEADAEDALSTVCYSTESLIRTQRPPIAVTKISGLFGRRSGTVTRSNSVYSTASARFGYTHNLHLAIPSFSRKHTGQSRMMRLPSNANIVRSKSMNKPRISRPETITRASSTGCSATSFCSEISRASERTEGEERARAALRERRMDCGRKLQDES
jgi:hypothetical protein